MNEKTERANNFKKFNKYFFIRYVLTIVFFLTLYCIVGLYIKKAYISMTLLMVLNGIILKIHFSIAQIINGKNLDFDKIKRYLYINLFLAMTNAIVLLMSKYIAMMVMMLVSSFLIILCIMKIVKINRWR